MPPFAAITGSARRQPFRLWRTGAHASPVQLMHSAERWRFEPALKRIHRERTPDGSGPMQPLKPGVGTSYRGDGHWGLRMRRPAFSRRTGLLKRPVREAAMRRWYQTSTSPELGLSPACGRRVAPGDVPEVTNLNRTAGRPVTEFCSRAQGASGKEGYALNWPRRSGRC